MDRFLYARDQGQKEAFAKDLVNLCWMFGERIPFNLKTFFRKKHHYLALENYWTVIDRVSGSTLEQYLRA